MCESTNVRYVAENFAKELKIFTKTSVILIMARCKEGAKNIHLEMPEEKGTEKYCHFVGKGNKI